MNVLKKVRNNTYINKAVRGLLKISLITLNKITQKWPVSGIIKIYLNEKELKFFARSDDGTVSTLFYERNYVETKELNLFAHLARKSKTIIDVGANTGLYSIVGAKQNPEATVYALEPNPINLIRLKKNIELNQLHNITLIEKALGQDTMEVSFTVPKQNVISDTSSVLPEFSRSTYKGEVEWKEIKVEQTSLDILFNNYKFKTAELVKIDVEGYEVNVFEGAKTFFTKYSPIILCEIFLSSYKKQYFENFLEEYGYFAYLVLKEGIIRLDGRLETNHDGLNYLFARGKTKSVFTSYKVVDGLIEELISTTNFPPTALENQI